MGSERPRRATSRRADSGSSWGRAEQDRLEAIASELRPSGAEVITVAVDVTRRAELDQMVQIAIDRFGRLDVLVSNAGISNLGPLADCDVDGWSAMIDVNLRGVLNGIAAAIPVFRRQGTVISSPRCRQPV